eukprot:s3755_g2.t1
MGLEFCVRAELKAHGHRGLAGASVVCPPTPRLHPAEDPILEMEPLELPSIVEEEDCVEVKQNRHATPPKAPRPGPSAVPFDISTIPEVWLPEAVEDEEKAIQENLFFAGAPSFGPAFKPGPSWELRGACAGLTGERGCGVIRMASSVCSTRCSSPGGMSQGTECLPNEDAPWPAYPTCRETTTMPVAFELLVNGGL